MTPSVIIPAYNAQSTMNDCLNSIGREAEIIVADGGSTDDTLSIARAAGAKIVHSAKGRGRQLNAGARAARGEFLIFLHADTTLAPTTFALLDTYFKDPRFAVGKFMMKFDHKHWLLDMYSRMTRHESLWTSFGDQGIVVRRSLYNEIGGFPDWPLFEDVRFFQEARRRTAIRTIPLYVTTSAGRFLKNGILKQQLRNGWLILQYLKGASPDILWQKYNR